MSEKNPLTVVSTDDKTPTLPAKHKENSRQATQAKYDRLWLHEPERFDVTNSSRERMRIERTLQLILDTISPSDKRIVDLGCGSGVLTRMLRDNGATVDAVDISQNALRELQKKDCDRIHLIQDYVPNTSLEDDAYDIVVATELIADLSENQFRIFFSELARIVNAEGYVVCSTPIDIQSENALQRFAELANTEFNNLTWVFSYHYLQIKLLDFFKAPYRFVKASKDKLYREKSLSKRHSVNKWWFKINSTSPLSFLWKVVNPLTFPFYRLLENNDSIVIGLEKLTKFFWRDSAVSHAIFIAKRRPIIPPTEKEFQPHELKHKKQVWE